MKGRFVIMYVLLVVAQIVICNYFRLSPYVMLTILPVLVLSLPMNTSVLSGMLIAFATGLCVDVLGEGFLGLNAFALVPVAYARKWLCKEIFGEEILEKTENFSIRKYGFAQVTFAITIVQALFLVLYIWADGGASRTFFFNLERFALSLVTGVLLSLAVADILKPENRR